jgi:hypothetical protein
MINANLSEEVLKLEGKYKIALTMIRESAIKCEQLEAELKDARYTIRKLKEQLEVDQKMALLKLG